MPYAPSVRATERYDLARFDLHSMIECGQMVRRLGNAATSMEEAAQQIVRFFYTHLVDDHTEQRNCVLVRCFKTQRFSQLPADIAQNARRLASYKSLANPDIRCLTLLATAGDLPEWNDRRRSRGHAAVPLESVDVVRRTPMLAALLRQMGLDIEAALYPSSRIILDADQHAFNVFHVENAVGDPSVPAQADFVEPHGIKSVLGFGGLLPSGDLFAVIMFSRTTIPRSTADMFRTIALGVKLALLPHMCGPIFMDAIERAPIRLVAAAVLQAAFGQTVEEQLRSEAATLRMLMQAIEAAALQQTELLQSAFADLQREEHKRRQQSTRLLSMLEATTNPVYLLNREWRFIFLNKYAKSLISQGRELLGSEIWAAFPNAAATPLWTNYQRAMHERVPVEFEIYIPAPLDKSFEVHAFPIEEGIAAFFHDITGRLKTEAALRQTEKLAVTGRLAASIAHEINNPLEAMTNLLYLLIEDDGLGAGAKALALQLEDELRRVSEITTHTLRFHRQSTRAIDTSLEEVLDSVLVLFQGRLVQAGVVVDKEYRQTPRLRSFAGELRQIFANLVGNALDACWEGCHIKLRVRESHEPATGRPGIRITVADTGRGMNKAVQARVFEPFFTTKGATGTGLGLWISRELIEKHGGAIRVRASEAKQRHGAVFAVFLPLATVAEKVQMAAVLTSAAAYIGG